MSCQKCDGTGYEKIGCGPMTRYKECNCQSEDKEFNATAEEQKLSDEFISNYRPNIDWSWIGDDE